MKMHDLDGPRDPVLSERDLYLVIDIAVLRLALRWANARTDRLTAAMSSSYIIHLHNDYRNWS